MNMQQPYKEFHDSTINRKKSFLSALFAILLTILLFLLSSLLIYLGVLKESMMQPLAFGITFLSALAGGFWNALSAKHCGWLSGICSGSIYMVFYYLCSVISGGKLRPSLCMLGIIVGGIFAAAVGGILGINVKADRKYRR